MGNATLIKSKQIIGKPYEQRKTRVKRRKAKRKFNEKINKKVRVIRARKRANRQDNKMHRYQETAMKYVNGRIAVAKKNDSTKDRKKRRPHKLDCIKIIERIKGKNHAYLILIAFADPS